jgi:hypothetical protein
MILRHISESGPAALIECVVLAENEWRDTSHSIIGAVVVCHLAILLCRMLCLTYDELCVIRARLKSCRERSHKCFNKCSPTITGEA